MAFCPFCRSRLWTDAWFGRGNIKCPRCGNQFRPTVHWGYFRLLVLVLVAVAVVIVISLPVNFVWLALLVAFLGFLIWLFPKLMDIQPLQGELTPTEGVMDRKDLELDLEVGKWNEKWEEFVEQSRWRQLILIAVALAVLLAVIVGLKFWR